MVKCVCGCTHICVFVLLHACTDVRMCISVCVNVNCAIVVCVYGCDNRWAHAHGCDLICAYVCAFICSSVCAQYFCWGVM